MARNPTRTRIALLSNYPPDHCSFTGGVETATAGLLEGLRAYQEEFEFHIVNVPNPHQADEWEKRDGFWFHFPCVPSAPWARPHLPWRVAAARRTLQSIAPDLVHCQGNIALGLAAALSRYRTVFTVHGVSRHEALKRTGWEFWSASADALAERFVHNRMDSFICISGYAADVIGSRRPAFSISNAVRTRFLQTRPSRQTQDAPCFLFVGVLAPLKRPADLLAAHAALRQQYPDLRTLLCGDTEDVRYAESMRHTLSAGNIEGVSFLGRQSPEQLLALLQQATALVLPSAQENAPMVVAEAMAVGIPVVATRVGGIPGMLKHNETGLLYETGDVQALKQCLGRLLADPALAARLGACAKQAAREAYTPERVAAATVAAYRHLLTAHPLVN